MTDLRCRTCGIPHHENPDASSGGGLGRILPWDGELCPVCVERRRERRQAAARRYAAILVDPDDSYCRPVAREQVTFEEVLG